MHFGLLPIGEQIDALHRVLAENTVLVDVLQRAAQLDLPGWYVTAGCVFQTVWNVMTGRALTSGIRDYDLFYFDDGDLSWEAEDLQIQRGRDAFAGIETPVEIRNEARVHLWYEQRFGVPCAPYASTEAAIDSFPSTSCCIGVRVESDGRWRIYAPHGLSDAFNLIVRPNPVLAPRRVYEEKTARWRAQWPELTVLPWPSSAG